MANDIHLFPNKPVRTTQNVKVASSGNGVRVNNDNIVALKSAEKAQDSKLNQDVTKKGSDTAKVSDAARHVQSVAQSTKGSLALI